LNRYSLTTVDRECYTELITNTQLLKYSNNNYDTNNMYQTAAGYGHAMLSTGINTARVPRCAQ